MIQQYHHGGRDINQFGCPKALIDVAGRADNDGLHDFILRIASVSTPNCRHVSDSFPIGCGK
jgi:hypothetical protein